MLRKVSMTLLISFFLLGSAAQAYDLPKFKPDKKISAASKEKKEPILKSDWKSAEFFEQKIKARLANGEKLAPDDSARVWTDKNYVFVAFYNDAPFFLDKYSINIKRNSDGVKSWEQRIFLISKNYSPNNATAIAQRFCLTDGKFFNSFKSKEALADLTNETDKNFLEECFRVGYYFAFGEESPRN